MTCKKYEGGDGFIAFMCDMGKTNVDKDKYDRQLSATKILLQEKKQLQQKLSEAEKKLEIASKYFKHLTILELSSLEKSILANEALTKIKE